MPSRLDQTRINRMEYYNGIELPSRLAALPRDQKNRPVPAFCAWIDGVPDFRVVDPDYLERAFTERLCWVCGQKLGKHLAFVIGPMCAINKVTAELPNHRDCALFSVQACPFLSTPQMHRRERDLPAGSVEPAGIALMHNPGLSLIWITKSFKPFSDGMNGVLFRIGDATEMLWFKEGKPATHEQIVDGINTGFPRLRQIAEQDGPAALAEAEQRYSWLMKSLTAQTV